MVLARTSEPPCFSVIAMPIVAPRFAATGATEASWIREVSFGRHTASRSGSTASAGTAAQVIVIGQQVPGSTWLWR